MYMKTNKQAQMYKKTLLIILITLIVIFTAACGNADNKTVNSSPVTESSNNQGAGANSEETEKVAKISVVTSFFPLFFLATEIGGDNVEVVNLIPTGIEPHDWTPKSQDLKTATNAQLLLYHGVGLEAWIDDFLKGLSKESKIVAKEMSSGIKLIHGDENDHEAEADHDDEHKADDDHNHSHDTDPHTWVSPKSMLIMAENVKNSLVEADAGNTDGYESNYEALKQKLVSLDEEYTMKLSQTTQKNIVVSHQAFGYLARDYGLTQQSIMGLNPDAEPKSQDILKIKKFVKENNVKYIFFEELVSDQLAQMLASEADIDTMVLNPLEGLTKKQAKDGETLLTLMERNLQNLLIALQ